MTYEFSCKKLYETDSAIKVYDGEKEVWIPLSQVEEMHFKKNGEGTMVVSDWIAEQKGLT